MEIRIFFLNESNQILFGEALARKNENTINEQNKRRSTK